MSSFASQLSSYMDSDFNFNNNVNYGDNKFVKKLYTNKNTVMLEPRLSEYIKKKRYYKENNIEPTINLEKIFSITDDDKKVIRSFLRGRPIYDDNNFNDFKDRTSVTTACKKQFFPSKAFRDLDPRVSELEKQGQKKFNIPVNRGMFAGSKTYDEPIKIDNNIIYDSRDFTGFSLNDTRFDPRSDPRIEFGPEKFNKYESQYRVNKNSGNQDSRRHYSSAKCNTYMNNYPECCFKSDDRVLDRKTKCNQNIASYGITPGPINYGDKSEMDTKNKVVIPNVGSNEKRNMSTYQYMSEFNDRETRDVDFELELIRGMPSSVKLKNRSYGYRNPSENYFSYISDDFQSAVYSVQDGARGGIGTRNDNKKMANQSFTREIF